MFILFFQGEADPQIDNILQNIQNCDPERVLKEVIPTIVKQGQTLMRDKKITTK